MEQDGNASCAKLAEEAIQPVCMVGITMAQDNGLNGTEVNAQHGEVVQCSVRRHSSIKEHCLTLPLVDHSDQQGNTKSASRKPDRVSFHSWNVRMGIRSCYAHSLVKQDRLCTLHPFRQIGTQALLANRADQERHQVA